MGVNQAFTPLHLPELGVTWLEAQKASWISSQDTLTERSLYGTVWIHNYI